MVQKSQLDEGKHPSNCKESPPPHNSQINVLNTYQTLSSSCWQKSFKTRPWLVRHLFCASPSAIPSCWRMDAGLEEISPSLTWCIFLLLLVDYIEPVLKDQAMINLQPMEVFWRTKMIQRSRWAKTWEWQRSRGRRVSPAVLQISIHMNQITKCWGSKEMSVVLWTLLECIIR